MQNTKRLLDDWLLSTALICLGIAIFLYLGGGYHAGFLTINGGSIIIPVSLWELITFLGDEFCLLSLVLFLGHRRPEYLRTVFWAVLCGLVLSRAMKYGFATYRPALILPKWAFRSIGPVLKHSSFPSGHSQLVFTVVGSLLPFENCKRTKIALLCGAGLVGISRVAVGVHWPIDVLIGAAVGLAAAKFGLWMAKQFNGRERFNELPLILAILPIFPLFLIIGYNPGLELPVILSPLFGMLVLINLVIFNYPLPHPLTPSP